ncbi:hypothetical protein [Pseudactinotalea suaedae]|uniref:hypothetical protein n=1 Tax=Pseudactinotalea suaedae TaxID=1524924 RepID=UPI0012E2829C|nr:hypothetical protein [Pseudactinotalea suaedae]
MSQDWFATFTVRQAAAVAGLGVALLSAAVVLGVLGGLVAMQPGAIERGDWFWLALGGSVMLAASMASFVIAFIKLCLNVEYLAREAVDRRSG